MYFSASGVGIELVNAPKGIHTFLISEIGFLKLDTPPKEIDILIKFVNKINVAQVDFAGDTFLKKDLFFIEDSKGKIAGYSLNLLKKTDIICEKDFNPREFYEWLEAILKYKIIKNKSVFLHASSFVYRGKGIIVCAWINAGKTNALLAFLSKGAIYLSDEFTMLNEKGEILAYPKRIDLRDFNVKVFPGAIKNLNLKKKLMFRLALAEKGLFKFLYKLGFKSLAKVGMDVAFSMRLSLKEIFPNLRIIRSHKADKIFFLLQGNASHVRINKMAQDEFVDKILATNIFERRGFIKNANAYSFLSGKEIDFEGFHKKEEEILSNALKSKEIYGVLIPQKGFSNVIKEMERLI